MAASRFVEVTDKEIREIKINSVPKNTKDWCKNCYKKTSFVHVIFSCFYYFIRVCIKLPLAIKLHIPLVQSTVNSVICRLPYFYTRLRVAVSYWRIRRHV